ncbi:hypothetical protein KP509_14G054500 [Ceratopteris richardii]|uniref:Peptidase A1 domain-containing protein n=1 Tax=Ceratopteris richardii TaxID=49495 RepID=A0A8T2TBX4_CERRI|nr:hypothetical protein KP509_14G054500 [Ceratopteris richardii]
MPILPRGLGILRQQRFHGLAVEFLILASWAVLIGGAAMTTMETLARDGGGSGSQKAFELEIVYKYSERFRELTTGKPEWEHVVQTEWPMTGSGEYYEHLAMEDRHRHRARNLLAGDVYSLAPVNETYYVRFMGSIQYTLMSLGTPPKLFLVALDTGSDLLWVPCDCRQCSDANWASYGVNLGIDFALYSPSTSTTSKPVLCNEAICSASTLGSSACNASAPQSCAYRVDYISANTSSSGTIVQDVIHFNQENGSGSNMTAEIYLGCGSYQTGAFLQGGAPNGLFGLGPEVYSVPSTMARNKLISNVFSMCFSSQNQVGRLKFGEKPDASLSRTPLVRMTPSVFYVVEIEEIDVGGVRLNVSRKAVFDTGTSLTMLPLVVAQKVGDAMGSNAKLTSFPYNQGQDPMFTHCWNATTKAEIQALSSISFVFNGGGTWPIKSPFIGFVDNNGNLVFVCLGIVAIQGSNAPPIIGFNFMSGYEFFFDMEASTLSWGASNCSGSAAASNSSQSPSKIPLDIPPILPSPSSSSPEAPPHKSSNSSTSASENKAPTSSSTYRYQFLYSLIPTAFFLLGAH